MTETPVRVRQSIVGHDVAEPLIELGWPVIPIGPEMERWAIGDFELTADELIGLAIRRGVRALDEKVH